MFGNAQAKNLLSRFDSTHNAHFKIYCMYCKNCAFWTPNIYKQKNQIKGECDAVHSIMTDKNPEITFEIEATADDDSNLSAELITGCNFGCVHFKQYG